ncbi:MAG: type II toxin-antitoxin system Phd/YefM family antitoxin [Oscillospiraceae bacterium]|nr:type II toxin-antitoxin system Phd/YefM family antitoxin [Oscillospiraceae bacterium]
MALPKIIPINELKNTAKISQTCKETDAPIIITKNGYDDMVIMSAEHYRQTVEMAEMYVNMLLKEALDSIDAGEPLTDGFAFLDELDREYGGVQDVKYGS